MPYSYNSTTWFYERLSKLVFGQAQVNAQNHFLTLIKPGDRVLIIGGGTGQILESLSRLHPALLQITYVEPSGNMMALSRRRYTGENAVEFIASGIEDADISPYYNVVFTAFLFDNFSEKALATAFPAIDKLLCKGGLWLDTDFQLTGPLWQKLMLKSMYYFFKLMRAVEVTKQPDTTNAFKLHNYKLLNYKSFYSNFIGSRVYQKP